MELLEWINTQSGTRFSSISEVSRGKELLEALIRITGLKNYFQLIKSGQTQLERTNNFQSIRKIFRDVGESFPFNIKKLTEGNEEELSAIVSASINIEAKLKGEGDSNISNDDEEINLILEQAEKFVQGRVRQQQNYIHEIEDIALERDFYLQKLLRIEQLASKFNYEDVSAVVDVIKSDSPDFKPIEK